MAEGVVSGESATVTLAQKVRQGLGADAANVAIVHLGGRAALRVAGGASETTPLHYLPAEDTAPFEAIEAFRAFVARASELTAGAEEVRSILAGALAQDVTEPPARLLSTAVVAGRDIPAALAYAADLETLGHDLRPGRTLLWCEEPAALSWEVGVALDAHRQRARLLSAARAAGAIGRIDSLAATLVAVSGETVARIVAHLREYDEFAFVAEDSAGRRADASLYWREGVLTGQLGFNDKAGWVGCDVRLAGVALPATVAMETIGLDVGTVVDAPLLGGAPVVDVDTERRATTIRVDLVTEWLRMRFQKQ